MGSELFPQKFIVINCPKCGNIQVGSYTKEITNYRMKCKQCNKSTKIYQRGKGMLVKIYFETTNPRGATEICQRIRRRVQENVETREA